MMPNEERIVRHILEMWGPGVEGVNESFRRYGTDDLVWWNSGRGALTGLDECLKGLDEMFDALQIAAVECPIRDLLATSGRVVVERSDNLYRADGTVIAKIRVTGVLEFDANKVTTWRDYCDDWISKLEFGQPVVSASTAAEMRHGVSE
ncbi:limonene-1,2-epoxide hydrolase [Mycobacterium intracellulare]|nr:limonene-1,2-epoxide hydrolase [Mycobacterium intracellulare]